MKKLLFIFTLILVSCDMSEENVVEQEEQNLYTLIIHNTNAAFQAYNRVELAGLTYVMESQNQSLIINGDKVAEYYNKSQLIDIPIKLYFECIPCSNVNGCEDTEEVQVSFIKATPTTKIQINRDTENWSEFFKCRHKHEITYN